MLLYLGLAGLGSGVLLAVGVVIYLLLGRSSQMRSRLRQLERPVGLTKSPQSSSQSDHNPMMRVALALSERAVARQGGQNRVEAGLERAGIALRPAEWLLVRVAVSVTCAVGLAFAMPWLVGMLLGLVAGWLGTAQYRRMRASRRERKFGDLLPESLQLVVGALRSGFSLPQAVDALVREGPEPIASEFGRAMAEIRLGGDLEDALERTANRNGSRDLAWLVMAIRIQREVGGNLSEVLETAVETMRERGRLHRHVRALSAEGRMSAYVLIGMPIVLAAWMLAFRREYIRPLYTEPLGLMMLAGAVVMVGLGTLWISRLIKVEV